MTHPLKHIRLTLARSKEFPAGSTRHGYDVVAPLDEQNHIDLDAWKANRAKCIVRRFWEGEDDQSGLLVHKSGGVKHGRWVFDYDPKEQSDDEPGFLFGTHAFVAGEYVSVRGHDGQTHTFYVNSITPLR
ncbi:MAG TPA: hypothetical protein VHD14_06325 [Pseudolabrys sp.]|nr:hypothetical protein [Pseudolabrys sp.]